MALDFLQKSESAMEARMDRAALNNSDNRWLRFAWGAMDDMLGDAMRLTGIAHVDPIRVNQLSSSG